MTFAFFQQQMDRLGGLRFRPAELQTHWEALKDLPDAVLEAAVSRAQKTRQEFPTPIELRVDADAVAHRVRQIEDEDRSRALPQPVELGTLPTGTIVRATREWRYYCQVCSDMGWRSLWCGDESNSARKPWMASQHCGRSREHSPHEWVTECACANGNPAILKRKERQQKYAAASADRKSA